MTKANTLGKVVPIKAPKAVKPVEAATPVVTAQSLYKNVAAVTKAIKAAHLSQGQLQVEYQRIAVSTIVLLEKHRDISIVRNLFNDMTINLPESLRLDTMQAFFATFAPVTFDEKTGEVFFDKEGKANVAEAMLTPWWTVIKRNPLKAFNLDQEIARLYDRASKRNAEPKKDGQGNLIKDAIDLATLNALKKLVKGGNTAKKAA